MFDESDGDDQMQQHQEMPNREFGSGDEIEELDDGPLPDNDIIEDLGHGDRNPTAGIIPEYQNAEEDGNEKGEIADDYDNEDDDEAPIAPSYLGNAIDSLMMHWCQLLTNVSVKAPVPPPSTLDHVKEVAEVCSKHYRDASVDVSNEFARLGFQWEMEQQFEQFVFEDANLDEALDRQEKLIDSVKEVLKARCDTYHDEYPNAGKHFTT